MEREIVLSQTAQETLEEILDYLLTEWSETSKAVFVERLDEVTNLLKSQPNMFPKSRKKHGVHKCVVTKHISLYYTFNDREINIITLFDNRMNPNSLNLA